MVSTCLSSRFPILLWWGPELVMIYNDALSQIIGNKHPRAMGQRGAEGWWEVWDLLGPMLRSVFFQGASTWSENQRLDIERSLKGGLLEETYFTFSYSPVRDESGGIGGVFCAVTETSAQVLSERRLWTLTALTQETGEVTTAGEACLNAAVALKDDAADVPAALVYLADDQGKTARLASAVGVTFQGDRQKSAGGFDWPLESVLETGSALLVDEEGVQSALEAMGAKAALPFKAALLLPLGSLGKPRPAGVLVVGLAPLLLLDDKYRNFLVLVAGHIGTAIASARALEAAQQRAEALAQLDRAKTAFFSNVSHEFRTPLTLMLGPTEDALASTARALTGVDLETVHRNELRMLRLVNTLLDFSRIEAGRADAAFAPTDLSALTRDFAAAFRAAIERAGIVFEVDCEPLAEPIYVDHVMWEKIVLNLLSNALKFTFDGSIAVALRGHAGRVTLEVRDSGVGIASVELPRVFDRFHRIEGTRSRTHEGTGIGLALVRDLVRLHGGDITVESRVGEGTTFTVSIPTGSAHLPPDRVRAPGASTTGGIRDQSFVTDASLWLPREGHDASSLEPGVAPEEGPGTSQPGARVLVVDDNVDMRDYVARLLRAHWPVDTAADGLEALEVARRAVPSLVLTDIMMPNLDGFGLLRALREDPRTQAVPVVMLSARAGEESRVEGLTVGADDYLIKPFSAKELVARVKTHLELGQLRAAAQTERNRLYAILRQAPAAVAVLRGPGLVFELANPRYEELVQRTGLVGKPLLEVFPELEDQPIHEVLRRAYTTGERFVAREFPLKLRRTPQGELEDVYFDFTYEALRTPDGLVDGVMVIAFDVSDRVRGVLREREARAELERASRAKDEFLAMLGHELRNPLTAISMALTMIERAGGDSAQSGPHHATARRQMGHLVRLVDDLLDISRVTRGIVELHLEAVNLAAVVQSALASARPAIEARRHELSVTMGAGTFFLKADATRLEQIFVNLLTNAAKYTDLGGQLSLRLAREVHEGQQQAVVRVRDNGRGIPRDMLDKVFDVFVQVSPAIDRSTGGLGLGLTLVKRLVELHGGTVSVHSDDTSKGSEFVVRLPLANEVPATARLAVNVSPPPPRPVFEKRRILLVEDSEDIAHTLKSILEDLGHDVVLANDGMTGADLLLELRPDVGLIDVGLPGIDGYEVARRVRAQPGGEKLYLVALTGYGGPEAQAMAKAAGFNLHLTKPPDIDVLSRVVSLSRSPEPSIRH